MESTESGLSSESQGRLHPLYLMMEQLERAKIHYRLARHRDDTVMLVVRVPGRYYEVEVFADGTVEVERFVSSGGVGGSEVFEEILNDFSE